MSDAPSSSEPLADHAAHPAPAQTDFAADAALILAALGRLETAVRDGREVLARLRVCLGDMAKAIVKARAMADTPTATSLLDDFEHRIGAMLEIAGAGDPRQTPDAQAPAIEAAPVPGPDDTADAESDEVPTVSNVVSRLGGDRQTPLSDTENPDAADHASVDASNVAMLTAMVQALRDSIPPDAPEAGTDVEAAPPDSQAAACTTAPGTETPPPGEGAAAGFTANPEPEQAATPELAAEFEEPPPVRRAMAAALPHPEFVSTPVEAVSEKPQAAPPSEAHPRHAASPPAYDPLRALKAMSENERLALFS